jgi:hypothetical protein
LLPNFNKMVRREILNMGVQQLEDVFSIAHTNFRAWINTSDLEENDVKLDDVIRRIIVNGTLLVSVCVRARVLACHWSHNGDGLLVVSEVLTRAEGSRGSKPNS